MSENTTITKKDLKAIQKKFKAGYKGYYIPDLVKMMNIRKDEMKRSKEFDEKTIYNIFNGIYKDVVMLKIFNDVCHELLASYNIDEAVPVPE